MRSQLQDTIELQFEKMVTEHPEYCRAIERAWDILVACRTPENKWLMDCFFQEQGDRRPGCLDVLFCSELVFQLLRGHLYYTGIDVKRPPVQNREEKLLDEITLAAVGAPFNVRFADSNGFRHAFLEWYNPVTVHWHREGRDHVVKQVEPGSAYLDIGYTRAITTGLALKEHRVLARWPLGHNFIYLIYTDLKGLFEGITDLSHWLDDRI
ncbi:MAG: hypothetical protein A4E57_01479 [Syntrophorhabdaceae bacterium PtaU1.Bin034]|jgi:hypothetical protein|nr:MAG: hypothetical protein A4E57_01479 [Syntrophorhabdaceae bacterium PtaU1.Bin034]